MGVVEHGTLEHGTAQERPKSFVKGTTGSQIKLTRRSLGSARVHLGSSSRSGKVALLGQN